MSAENTNTLLIDIVTQGTEATESALATTNKQLQDIDSSASSVEDTTVSTGEAIDDSFSEVGSTFDTIKNKLKELVVATIGSQVQMAEMTFGDFVQNAVIKFFAMWLGKIGMVISAYLTVTTLIRTLISLFTGDFYKSKNIDAVIKLNDEVMSLQKSMKISSTSASAYSEAIDRLGANKESVVSVHNNIREALRKNTDELDRLGVAYKTSNGVMLSNREIVLNAKTVIDSYTDGYDRSSAAIAMGFGTYEQLNEYLKISQTELDKSTKRVEAFGLSFTPEKQQYIKEYEDAMREFGQEANMLWSGIKNAIADQLIPSFTELSKIFKDTWPGIIDIVRGVLATVTTVWLTFKTTFEAVVIAIGIGMMKLIEHVDTVVTVFQMLADGASFSEIGNKIKEKWKIIDQAEAEGYAKIEKVTEKNGKMLTLAWGGYSKNVQGINEQIVKGKDWVAKETDKSADEEIMTVAELEKVNEAYYKSMGDTQKEYMAKRLGEQAKDVEAVEAYFDVLAQEHEGNATVLAGIEKMKASSIAEINQKYLKDNELAEIENESKSIGRLKFTNDTQIAEIKRKVAANEISEKEGVAVITKITEDFLQKQLENAKRKVDIFKVTDPTGENYKKAADTVLQIEKALIDKRIENIETIKKAQEEAVATEQKVLENEYTRQLIDLENSYKNKFISDKEYNLKKLELEKQNAKDILDIRIRELEATPELDVKKYQTALDAKLAAELTYAQKSTSLEKETNEKKKADSEASLKKTEEQITKKVEKHKEAEDTILANSRAFASTWGGIWDNAYNTASSALSKLSDAAYNAFAKTYELPQKTTESLEALRQKASEAEQNFANLHTSANNAALAVSAAWSDSYRKLYEIPETAAQITSEFYRQKIAAKELADALENPTNITSQLVGNAENAVEQLDLLDSASLSKIRNSIDGIKNAMVAFAEKVTSALKSLQDEWDSMTMSKLELEEKRYNAAKVQWEKDYQKAKALGDTATLRNLEEQLALIEKIHKAKEEEIEKETKTSSSSTKKQTGASTYTSSATSQLSAFASSFLPSPQAAFATAEAGNNFINDWGRNLKNLKTTEPQKPNSLVFNISVQKMDEATVRKEIIPVIERYTRLRS